MKNVGGSIYHQSIYIQKIKQRKINLFV